MINNRQQNGRRRGRGGQRPPGSPGQPGGGNRIDSRARGNAQQLHEKYRNLAQDSQRQGDRVTTEYYLQFADHYFRVLNESRARFEEQRPRQQDNDDDYDGDEGDEFAPRGQQQPQQQQPRYEERRERAPEQARSEQPRGEQARSEGDEQGERGDGNRGRRDRNRRRDEFEPRVERAERAEASDDFQGDRLPLPPSIGPIGDDQANDDGEAPAPRRRGRRPRLEASNDVEVPPAA